MTTDLFNHITTDTVSSFFSEEIHVDILRLDKIHPVISGNKWFKLRYYLEEARLQNKTHIVTFGGAWSNHIAACAAASKEAGFACTGIIRGEEPLIYSATLLQAKGYGMDLIFTSRQEYKEKVIPVPAIEDYYHIPEGGYGKMGAKGAGTLLDFSTKNYTHYCCAVGTGTMIAGIINAVENSTVIGIPVLKNNSDLQHQISFLVTNPNAKWQLIEGYHFGGYARYKQQLLSYMNEFYQRSSIPTDFVYTGKLLFGVHDLIQKNFFPSNSRLLIIHSGGLQGNASLAPNTLLF